MQEIITKVTQTEEKAQSLAREVEADEDILQLLGENAEEGQSCFPAPLRGSARESILIRDEDE